MQRVSDQKPIGIRDDGTTTEKEQQQQPPMNGGGQRDDAFIRLTADRDGTKHDGDEEAIVGASSSETDGQLPVQDMDGDKNDEPIVEGKADGSPPSVERDLDDATTTTSDEEIIITTDRKLLILISSKSLQQGELTRKQNKILLVLDQNHIPYETVDGADPNSLVLRDELFSISCRPKGTYPLLFFVLLSDGSVTYWGDYGRFDTANDDGILVQELQKQEQQQQLSGPGDQNDGVDATTTYSSTEQRSDNTATGLAKGPMSVKSDQTSTDHPINDGLRGTASDDAMMEQFSQQIQRLEENHQAERIEMERQHAEEIEKVRNSLNHEQCLKQAREMEKTLMAQIHEKESEMHELARTNEGYKLKLDVLQREVDGTQKLLETKDTDLGKVSEAHNRDLKSLEDTLRDAQAKEAVARQEADMFKKQLQNTEQELQTSVQDHSDLKARVKVVAGELKERRVECRELGAKVVDLTETNEQLLKNLECLELQVNNQNRSQTEKDEEMEQLRAQLVDAAAERERLIKAAQEKEAQAEKTLAEYKKKAQSSLALANSRSAAAVLAKEEAELEARAARSASDSAMERAVKAEIASKESLAEAQLYVKDMERDKAKAVKELDDAREELKSAEDRCNSLQGQLEQSTAAKDKQTEKWKQALSDVENEKTKVRDREADLANANNRANELRDDIATLRDQLQATEAAMAAHAEDASKKQEEIALSASVPTSSAKVDPEKKASDEATIVSLQGELRDAREAIEELKGALKNALELNEKGSSVEEVQRHNDEEVPAEDANPSPTGNVPNGSANESTPLFFAMEKQAELKTARNEIQRLANLLAEIQSEKMEAQESMGAMRMKMEDAEARLQRYEKLSSKTVEGENFSTSPNADHQHGDETDEASTRGSTNIEYLKNVMLRYLNAKTHAERKALVPVIGAVLCLTADEQKKAMENVDESSSLGGVGSSLFESLSGMYHK